MKILLFLFSFLFSFLAAAKTVEYELIIDQGDISVGKFLAKKFRVNGGVPGPLLTFHVGDIAKITVVNRLDHETMVHWHGILLPNDQDGVPYLTSRPIPAQGHKVYQFPLTHSGTYWYHSHVMFQEQDGVYGAIRVLPNPFKATTPEETILFSDFSVENGQTIRRNLKRDGDYYAIKKGNVQSWWAALTTGNLGTKFRNSLQRMEGMDYSDVGYDAFLANGKVGAKLLSSVDGKRVKLRLINGSGSTIYKVTYGHGPMTIIEADGNQVEPLKVNVLPLSVAETYDVLVDIPMGKKIEIRATSIDNSGYASAWVGSGKNRVLAPAAPWINPMSLTMSDSMGMGPMSYFAELQMNYSNEFKDFPRDIFYEIGPYRNPKLGMDHSMGHSMGHGRGKVDEDNGGPSHNHHQMTGPTSWKSHSSVAQQIMTLAPKSQHSNIIDEEANYYNELTYGLLKAKEPIDIPLNTKLRTFYFTLNGNMENYVWTINGRPFGPESYIKINKGERVRFVIKNTTMMNHPMHLHGHFFRVMTDREKWSVLKHTVNVASMAKVVIEFDGNETKDWLFHCHVLYHMMDGMTRIVRYHDDPGSGEMLELRKKSREFNMRSDYFLSSKLMGQSNYSRLEGKLFSAFYMFEYDFIGNYEGDIEGEVHAARTLTRYLNLYIGAKAEAEMGQFDYTPTLGLTWVLPLNLEIDVKYQPEFQKKLEIEIENEIQITRKLQLNLEYSTVRRFYTELEYRQNKNLSFVVNYNKTYNLFGAGLGFTY